MREQKQDYLIDATYGNRLRSIIQTDGGYIYLSSIHPQTLAIRLIQTYSNDQKYVEKLEIEDASQEEEE